MIINENIKPHHELLVNAVQELVLTSDVIGHNELSKTISDIAQRIEDPFMFVIVGEVKAGKSSFINALLGQVKKYVRLPLHQ